MFGSRLSRITDRDRGNSIISGIVSIKSLQFRHPHAKSNDPSPSKHRIINHRLNIHSPSSRPFPYHPPLALISNLQQSNNTNASNDVIIANFKTVPRYLSVTTCYPAASIDRQY